jgi:hypothetical protein
MFGHYDCPLGPSMPIEFHRITRRWLARLSFSFLVFGFFLAWEGYKRYAVSGQIDDWRTLLYFVAAALNIVVGFTGVRERHRPEE